MDERFAHDRFLVDQLVRPLINLYRVTPLAAGETPAQARDLIFQAAFLTDVQTNNNWHSSAVFGNANQFYQGDAVTFSDANNGHYAVSIAASVSPTSVAFSNSSGNYTVTGSSGIGGTTGLTVNGGGSVSLGNPNTFAVVNGGPVPTPWAFLNKSGETQPARGEFLEEGVDLTALGTCVREEQWYRALLEPVASALGLEQALRRFWFDHDHLTPVERWLVALRDVVQLHSPYALR